MLTVKYVLRSSLYSFHINTYIHACMHKMLQNYNARMEKTGRPVSPHISMYQFPIVVFSSGINRVTGVLMTFGAASLGTVELVAGSGSALHLMETIGSSNAAVAYTFKFGTAFHILYHYAGGVRHHLWDVYPGLLTNEKAEQSAYLLMGVSTAASVGCAFL
jgi:succinate dehydrogenase (ubiquinone) cytochrome b560 subunit